MKFLKSLFYGTAIFLMLVCGGILVCALNPALTEKLANALYGDKEQQAVEVVSKEDSQEKEGGLTESILSWLKRTSEDDKLEKPLELPDSSSGLAIHDRDDSYVDYGEEQLNIPQSMDGKTGYEQIVPETATLGEQEAKAITEELSTGADGSRFKFDEKMYPYYGMLDDSMKALYSQIYANAMDREENFAPVEKVTVSQLQNVFEAVYNDHPELFWLETGYSCKYKKDGTCVEIGMKYNDTVFFYEQANTSFLSRAEEILEVSRRLPTVSEKEKYVHDALITKVDYSESAAMNQSAYSALVSGKTVCAGYARAFQYLMQQMEIPCYYCTGYSGQDHAWNIIALDNGYANVDVTWDDTEPSTYDYYNKSDEEYKTTHARRGLSVYLPRCGGNQEIVVPLGKDDSEDSKEAPSDSISGEGSANQSDASGINAVVIDNMVDYYSDCKKKMIASGLGDHIFNIVVSDGTWGLIEDAYSKQEYYAGYVDDALQQLGGTNFTVQLQGVMMEDGNVKVYHSISAW